MIRSLSMFCLLVCTSAMAVDPATLAEESDLVAVAVVEQADYQKTRSFPSSGSAFLKLLIVYKGDEQAGDWIEVKEKGLGDEKCYYPEPNPFVFEGARFFVFLRKENDVYRGVAPGCRIPLYVTDANQYAVRYPVDGLDIPEQAAQKLTFTDPAAVVEAGDFTSAQITELTETYHAELIPTGPYEPNLQNYRYTMGVPLTDFRRMAFPPE